MKWKIIAIVALIIAIAAVVYAATITGLTEYDDHPAALDVFTMVDVSNTTQAATGSTRKIQAHNLFLSDVVVKTSSYTLVEDDNGQLFTNAGSGADITFTLPQCTSTGTGDGSSATVGEGWWATIYIMDTTYEVYIDPNANDSLADISPNENGEYVSGDNTVGSMMTVTCLKGDDGDYDMYSIGYRGTWTQQD